MPSQVPGRDPTGPGGRHPEADPEARRRGDPGRAGTRQAIERIDVLGVHISAVDPPMAMGEIERWIARREQHYVCVTGVHGVMECQRDEELRAIHNASGLTTPDGMPMVWAGRRAGATWMRRVYGPDLMLGVLERAASNGWSSFFYGGREGVPERLAARLAERFPGLQVAGTWSPPFRPLTPDEDEELVARINAAAPDLVWVGLSTPKQERWMAAHAGRLQAPVLLGVGAAFDIHAGTLRQAPPWMQRSGLEWLYRLYREPRRLWRRYGSIIPRFLVAILRRPPRRLPAADAPASPG
jgi:N-acetylglucosaminyldiphosphoundecaprenol N-acetyl-beta-D-mannosaminyltransferase